MLSIHLSVQKQVCVNDECIGECKYGMTVVNGGQMDTWFNPFSFQATMKTAETLSLHSRWQHDLRKRCI